MSIKLYIARLAQLPQPTPEMIYESARISSKRQKQVICESELLYFHVRVPMDVASIVRDSLD